jgi:hypothetical protein
MPEPLPVEKDLIIKLKMYNIERVLHIKLSNHLMKYAMKHATKTTIHMELVFVTFPKNSRERKLARLGGGFGRMPRDS